MGRAARRNKERVPRVVEAYVGAAREILPTVFRPDCCLNGTRVCIEALKVHGVNARPLVVDMVVANEVANRMFEEHDGWPRAEADVARWMAEGAWVIQIDERTGDGKLGWAHHMIADAGELLVDSALGQASRPAKRIELPSVAAFPRGLFSVGRATIVYDAPDGVTIGLRHRPDVRDYASGFARHADNMAVVARVAERMEQLMRETT